MTKEHEDLIRKLPKRVAVLSLMVSVLLIIGAHLLGWSKIHVLSGFLAGVIANLISFRLIVIGAKKLLDASEHSMGSGIGTSFLGRFGIYVLCLFLVAQLSVHAIVAFAVGASMVGVALKLDGFFRISQQKTAVEKE